MTAWVNARVTNGLELPVDVHQLPMLPSSFPNTSTSLVKDDEVPDAWMKLGGVRAESSEIMYSLVHPVIGISAWTV